MTPTEITALIQWFTIVGGACFTVITIAAKWFKTQEIKYKENSVGETKVKELELKYSELKSKLVQVEEHNIRQQQAIDTAAGDYRTLLMQVMTFMGSKH
jgi:hypothetical protein